MSSPLRIAHFLKGISDFTSPQQQFSFNTTNLENIQSIGKGKTTVGQDTLLNFCRSPPHQIGRQELSSKGCLLLQTLRFLDQAQVDTEAQ